MRITPGTIQKAALLLALVLMLVLPFLLRPRETPTDGASSAAPSGAIRKLVVISPHWEGIRAEFGRAFSDWTVRNLGHATEIEWLDIGGTSDGVRYVRSEFSRSPEGIGVDLFFGGGLDPYLQFKKENMLETCPVADSVLAAIPAEVFGIQVYDPDRRWFGACFSGFGIIFNREVLRRLDLPEPKAWHDLAEPRFFSWVGSGDPRSSGSVHMAYEIILQAYGWERGWSIVARMCGNIRNFSRSGSQVPKDAASGEIACGMAIDQFAWRQVAEVGADRMGFVLPEGMTVINPDSIAVLKGAPSRDLAVKFIEFTLGEAGQKMWVLKPGAPDGPARFALTRLPIIPGLAARLPQADVAVPFDAYSWKTGLTYDSEKGSVRWTILNDLIGAVIIDTHPELVAAWNRLKNLPPENPAVRRLLAPPCTEQELLDMANGAWNDAAARARIKTQWAGNAQALYTSIAGGD